MCCPTQARVRHAALLMAEAPSSKRCRRRGRKAETGGLSPSILPTGSRISLTIFTTGPRPVSSTGLPSSAAFAQLAGTSTTGEAVAPNSIATLVVHIDDVWPLLQVGVRRSVLHVLDGLVLGDDLAREKNADCWMVFVLLPMPICWARSIALIMTKALSCSSRCSASRRRRGGAQLLELHWLFTRNTPPALSFCAILKPLVI